MAMKPKSKSLPLVAPKPTGDETFRQGTLANLSNVVLVVAMAILVVEFILILPR
jgi:hypothetical protein